MNSHELNRAGVGHDANRRFGHLAVPVFLTRLINFRTVAKLLLFIVALVGAAWVLRGLNLRDLRSVLADASPGWLAVSLLANIMSQIARAAGWNSMLTGVRRIRFSMWVRIEFAVQAAAAVTPEGAGELIRIRYLSHLGVTRTRTLTVMFVRKFFACVSLVPFLSVLWWPSSETSNWWLFAAWLYIGVLVIVAFLLIWAARFSTPPTKIGRTRRAWLDARAAVGPIRDPKVIARIGSATLLTRLCDIIGLWAITCALGVEIPWHVTALILLSLEFSMVLPNAPAQIGTFEAAVLIATSGTLVQSEGLVIALIFHAQQLLPQIPLGVAAIFEGKLIRRKEGETQ